MFPVRASAVHPLALALTLTLTLTLILTPSPGPRRLSPQTDS